MSKIAFRVSDGLDGADHRVINVGYPDITNKTDGVNIQYFIDENTIQQYDETRKYKKDFAVIFNDRVYYAKRDVPTGNETQAGKFNETHWQMVRTDPSWQNISSVPPTGMILRAGDFISADPSYSDLDFILPRSPENGDTVVIKDVSARVATMKLIVRTTDKILDNGKADYQLTYPKATLWITYDRTMDLGKGGWRINTVNSTLESKVISPSAQGTQASNGDQLFRRSASGKITIVLPRYANDGDSIITTDLDRMTASNNLTIKTHPNSTSSVGSTGTKSMTFKTSGWGQMVYSLAKDTWELWDGDEYERWTKINTTTPNSTITLIPSARVLVTGSKGGITFTLPPAPAAGDSVKLSLRNASKGVNIIIKASVGDKIHATPNMLGIPRLNDVVDYNNITPVTEINHTATGYGEQIKFVYVEEQNSWTIAEQSVAPYKASSVAAVRSDPGLVSFATEAEVLKNSEQTPNDESAVTPLTLSKKVATETNRGIAKIASQGETNADTNDTNIVTPKKLAGRTATEGRTGIAKIVSQNDANAAVNDTDILTAKKLAGRTATEGRTGILSLTKVGGAKQTARNTAGAGINNFNDHATAVTPKTLHEKEATENNLGLAFWATQVEVNNGADGNFFVRPNTLAARTATATRTGLARMVDMVSNEHLKSIADSIDGNVFITPKALASRIATFDMDGISRAANNGDVTNGTINTTKYITPANVKFYSETKGILTSTDTADGLNISGNLWTGIKLNIDQATETKKGTMRIATDTETNAGANDSIAITPKKLNQRTATTGRTGIIRIATPAEAAAGTLDNVAITPSTMGSIINESPEWGSTEVRRGSVYIGTLTNDAAASTVWQGNDVSGSTRALVNYKHESYAVSPRGLNTALGHYLPKAATAVNSTKFNNMIDTQFMRADKDTSTTGSLGAKSIYSDYSRQIQLPVIGGQGFYTGWDSSSGKGQARLMNQQGNGIGGFSFWNGANSSTMKEIASISATGGITSQSLLTRDGIEVNGNAIIKGNLTYKGQNIDDRYVAKAGSKMTGNLEFNSTSRIVFDDNGNTTGVPHYLIQGKCGTSDTGYIAVGATAADAGYLEIGTQDNGNEPIYVRQRTSNDTITSSATLLDSAGNTTFPKQLQANLLVITNTATGAIKWGSLGAQTANNGDINGQIWGGTWLSNYLKTQFEDRKVNRAGDTITGSLTVKKDVIVEGNFKIKVGNKFLVIRPNAANETVSFDWE